MLYRVARSICRFILLFIRRWEVSGAENLPPSGGVIIISNHISYWDPVVVGCVFNRRINFMAKDELFKIPVLSWLITKLGAFPVKRGSSDTSAIRHSLSLLKSGEVIGIFPEGSRSSSQELQELRSGAAMLALKGNTPILPVIVKGTRGVFSRVQVVVGTPLEYSQAQGVKASKKDLIQNFSNIIMDEMDRLKSSC